MPLRTASNEITVGGELQLVCGRPTLALSSALVLQTLSYENRIISLVAMAIVLLTKKSIYCQESLLKPYNQVGRKILSK